MEGYFCPDYSGETLKVINCNDANWTFRCFLCYKGRVFKRSGKHASDCHQLLLSFRKDVQRMHLALCVRMRA